MVFSVVVRRSSCFARQSLTHFYYFLFFKTTIVTIFILSISRIRGIQIFKIHSSATFGTSWARPTMLKTDAQVKKISNTCVNKFKYMVMVSMKLSTEIVWFMAPESGVRVQVLGWNQYSNMVRWLVLKKKRSEGRIL